MTLPLQILILSDGKAGHENQSHGLAEAMARRHAAEIRILTLEEKPGAIARVRKAIAESRKFPDPDFIIAAGHATHLSLLCLSRKYGARSILLMKPLLPMGFFDWCVIPEHDFKQPPAAKNVILSKGALNRVVCVPGAKSGNLILVGGPSKTHGYDETKLVEQIKRVTTEGSWQVADSRRTPASFFTALGKAVSNVEFIPHQATEPGWLAAKLSEVEQVRVTEDSVSMIYEALSSGCRVGILEMPGIRKSSRVIGGLERLRAEGYFESSENGRPPVLAEADRCAKIILGE
ncbi:MAG: mitochondrial fission ELM1 family protein [Armatimonadetes bacterium]|nr:mitochondrial fission ELM1 family protein [Akkermansiaceae bacterium]